MTEIKYERKCKNWIQDFAKWTLPRSEAPESFIAWTGLFTLASMVRRHVRVPKSYLGSYDLSPNLYILFIAGAGKARKSTTGNYSPELLDDLPEITQAPELITKESLLGQIIKSNDATMSIYSPEFGEFMAKSGPDMYGFLTNIYDGKKRISVSTLSRGVELAERPCVNLLGATTPEWVAANMPESVIGGGFASRVIFIREKGVRRRQLYFTLDQVELGKIKQNLIDDLRHIGSIEGDFVIDPDAKGFMEEWYSETADRHTEAQYKMHGYFERKPAHVHKIAMLIHMAYSDELVLYEEDFKTAISLLGQLEKNLPDVFAGIGKNPYVVDMKRIMAYVIEKGKVTRKELLNQFEHVAQPYLLNSLIDGAIQMGALDVLSDEEGKTWLYVKAQALHGIQRPATQVLEQSPLTELENMHELDH